MVLQLLNLIVYCCSEDCFILQSLEEYFACEFKFDGRRDYLAVPFWLWWGRKSPPWNRSYDDLTMDKTKDDICWFYKWSDADNDLLLVQSSLKSFLNHNKEEIAFKDVCKINEMLQGTKQGGAIIHKNPVSSAKLLDIFINKIGTNNVRNFDEAKQLSIKADTIIRNRKEGDNLKPLLGLPITIVTQTKLTDFKQDFVGEIFDKYGAIIFLIFGQKEYNLFNWKFAGFTPLNIALPSNPSYSEFNSCWKVTNSGVSERENVVACGPLMRSIKNFLLTFDLVQELNRINTAAGGGGGGGSGGGGRGRGQGEGGGNIIQKDCVEMLITGLKDKHVIAAAGGDSFASICAETQELFVEYMEFDGNVIPKLASKVLDMRDKWDDFFTQNQCDIVAGHVSILDTKLNNQCSPYPGKTFDASRARPNNAHHLICHFSNIVGLSSLSIMFPTSNEAVQIIFKVQEDRTKLLKLAQHVLNELGEGY